MSNLWLAFSFLTTLPLGRLSLRDSRLGKAAMWFPLVGGVLGGIFVAVGAVCGKVLLFPHLITSVLVLAAWAWLTGGLHLDGVADCGDGLLVTAPVQRRLQIMQDPRLGSFGAMALFFFLLMKGAALYALEANPLAILMAAILSRWVLIPIAGMYAAARPQGMAETLHRELGTTAWKVTFIYPIALVVIGGWPAVVMTAAAIGAAWCIASFANRRIGGMTGDVYGLLIEGTEIAVLLTALSLMAHNRWI